MRRSGHGGGERRLVHEAHREAPAADEEVQLVARVAVARAHQELEQHEGARRSEHSDRQADAHYGSTNEAEAREDGDQPGKRKRMMSRRADGVSLLPNVSIARTTAR